MPTTPSSRKLGFDRLESRDVPSATGMEAVSPPIVETAHVVEDSRQAIDIVMSQNGHETEASQEHHLPAHAVDQVFIGSEHTEHEEYEESEDAEKYKEAKEMEAKRREIEEAGNEATILQDEEIKGEGEKKKEEGEEPEEEEGEELEEEEAEGEEPEFEGEGSEEAETLFENPDKEVEEKLRDPFVDFKPEKLLSEKELWKVHARHSHADEHEHAMLHALAGLTSHAHHDESHAGTDHDKLHENAPHGKKEHGTQDAHGNPAHGTDAHEQKPHGKEGEGEPSGSDHHRQKNHQKETKTGATEDHAHADPEKKHGNEQGEQEQEHTDADAAAALARAGLLPALAANETSALSVTEIDDAEDAPKQSSVWRRAWSRMSGLFRRK